MSNATTLHLSDDAVTALKVAVEHMVDDALVLTTNPDDDHRRLFDTLTLLDVLRDARIPNAAELCRADLIVKLDYVASL